MTKVESSSKSSEMAETLVDTSTLVDSAIVKPEQDGQAAFLESAPFSPCLASPCASPAPEGSANPSASPLSSPSPSPLASSTTGDKSCVAVPDLASMLPPSADVAESALRDMDTALADHIKTLLANPSNKPQLSDADLASQEAEKKILDRINFCQEALDSGVKVLTGHSLERGLIVIVT